MTDYVTLQDDLTALLKSADTLSTVNVVQYRKLRLQAELDASALWQTPRNGKSGVGILVQMPEIETVHANLPGPEFTTRLNFDVVEEPNINMDPTVGSLLSAEEVAQRVAELLHGYGGGNWGGALFARGPVIQPASDWPEGLLAYRVQLNLKLVRTQTARVATPTITEDHGEITLACTTADSVIYVTADGSFPGTGNPLASIYTVPWAAVAGQSIRAAAYADGLLPSFAIHATVT